MGRSRPKTMRSIRFGGSNFATIRRRRIQFKRREIPKRNFFRSEYRTWGGPERNPPRYLPLSRLRVFLWIPENFSGGSRFERNRLRRIRLLFSWRNEIEKIRNGEKWRVLCVAGLWLWRNRPTAEDLLLQEYCRSVRDFLRLVFRPPIRGCWTLGFVACELVRWILMEALISSRGWSKHGRSLRYSHSWTLLVISFSFMAVSFSSLSVSFSCLSDGGTSRCYLPLLRSCVSSQRRLKYSFSLTLYKDSWRHLWT